MTDPTEKTVDLRLQCWNSCNDGILESEMNLRYHRTITDRFAKKARCAKIAVGILSAITLGLTFAPANWLPATIALAFAAAIAGAWVNVADYDKEVRHNDSLYRRWVDQRRRWEFLKALVTDNPPVQSLPILRAFVLNLVSDSNYIESEQGEPDETLLGKCDDEACQMLYNKTRAQLDAEQNQPAAGAA